MNRASVTQSVRTGAIVLIVLMLGAWGCARAYAQEWLPDRAYAEGPGFKVGDLELHPGVALRAGYNSNVFRTDGSAAYPRTGSAMLAVTPHLFLTTESTLRAQQGEDASGQALPPIAFSMGVSGTYFEYFNDEAQPRGVRLGVDTAASLTVLPGRRFNLDLSAEYQRRIQPFTLRLPGDQNYAMNTILPRARLNMGSKSNVFKAYVGYAPRFAIFEKKSAFNYLNMASHTVEAGTAWRFLPSTALVNDNELSLQNFFGDPNQDPESATYVRDSKRFQSRLGVNGAITQKLNLRVLAGYALIKFDDNRLLSDYEGPVGEAVLSLKFGRASVFDVGYQGTVTPSYIGGWTRLDRGFAGMRLALGGVFTLGLEAGAGYAIYGRLLRPSNNPAAPVVAMGAGNTTERSDVRIDGAVRGEYRVTNWLAFMADFTVIANLTEFEFATSAGTAPSLVPPFPGEFVQYQIFGGVRAFY